MHIVLDADVKNSRKSHFMKDDFIDKMVQFNKQYQKEILVPFTIFKGDEIQGVLRKDANIFKMIRILKFIFLPYELRIAIGIGSIEHDEKIKAMNNSIELNGEAFFNARDAMDYMKESRGKKEFEYNVYMKSSKDVLDQQINLMYSFIDDSMQSWKEDLFEITLLEEMGLKHEEIALTLLKKVIPDVTSEMVKKERINITKKINRVNWYKIKQAEQMLYKQLKEGIN